MNNVALEDPAGLTYLKWGLGFLADVSMFVGSLILAKEALKRGKSLTTKENALRGLKFLIGRGLGPSESRRHTADSIIEQEEARKIVQDARVGVVWIAFWFFVQILLRIVEVYRELTK